MRRQASMSSMGGTPRGLARSSSGVWWKLGDATNSSEVERRLRGIAEEEAAVRARVERRHAAAPAVRRGILATSMGLEAVALVYGLWTAARRRSRKLLVHLLLPAVAVPAMSTLVLAALARFRRSLDERDQHRLRTERKAKIGSFRGSHHNLQKLIEKYDDPDDDAADSVKGDARAATKKKLKRTHSRLSFHVGDE